MSLDGKLFARARDRLAQIKKNNESLEDERKLEVYAKHPEIQRLDKEISRLVIEAVGHALKKGEDTISAVDAIKEKSLDLQAHRAELLFSAGYNINYLDEIYNCPSCKDTGFTAGKPCSCLMALYRQEVTKELSNCLRLGEECFESFNLGYYSDVIDPEYRSSPRERMATVLEICRSFAKNFSKSSPNLLFQGSTGLGKTFLSASIAKVVAERGFSVVYDTANGVMQTFESQKFSRDDESSDAAESEVYRYMNCDLMILDDLGTEMSTAFSTSALYNLINTRLTNGNKTIISTNLSYKDMRIKYSAQITSRLEGEYLNLNFVGNDIRAIKKSLSLEG